MGTDALDEKQDIGALGDEGTADEAVARLACLDTMKRRLDSRDAGSLFTHEGARGTGDLVDDRDISGHQIGELREEERRPQFRRKLLVQQNVAVVALQGFIDDQRIDLDVALTATGGDNHVHRGACFGIFFETGVIKRQTGGKDAEPLPVFHLALVAFDDLGGPVDFRKRMDRIRREALGFHGRLAGGDRRQERDMRILADALTGDNANTGDHNIIVRLHLCPLSRTCSFRRAFKANRDPSGSRFKLLFHSMP
ncbi:hypothetical protein D3C73_560540 [compost metagenome]